MRFLRKAIAHHFLCGSDVSELAFIAEPHQPESRCFVPRGKKAPGLALLLNTSETMHFLSHTSPKGKSQLEIFRAISAVCCELFSLLIKDV
jgi:hypothetical protein